MARKIRVWVFSVLAFAMVGFIFFNSFQSGQESNAASGWVADFLRPLLNPNGWLEEGMYHKFIRKLAHFAEFGVLGLCLGGIAANLTERKCWPYAALTGVAVACIDETIQAFTGRTNSIVDVGIDSVGALCGLTAAAILVWIIGKIKKKEPS